ncbi:hypothetical protein [Brevundimonas sp.]|uniref:hypothetical protein n=1 Tax=Brevundimonas sp. TaxID=1871086 RepID=UPI003AF8C527
MGPADYALIGVGLLAAAALFHPRLLKSDQWRATVTPLASIIGSGFLVAGPVLASLAGNLAIAAMLGLCAAGYLFGSAIRYNIAHVEPGLDGGAPRAVKGLERVSELALALAYFVSVAYYLHLFAAFGLRLGEITDPVWIRAAATVVIATVGLIGGLAGLNGLEKLAIGAVALKLAVIAGLFGGLAVAAGLAIHGGTFAWSAPVPEAGLTDLRVLLGLVILVQGFETSRFLGAAYDGPLRIRTMRHAQWIATAIYLVFFLLITSHFTGSESQGSGETAIIDILRPVGIIIAPAIILAALASQLSAAVADMNGAGGLLHEVSGHRVRVRWGNVVTAAVAIVIVWTSNIYEIITWASRAFVLYYALQSIQAAWAAGRQGDRARVALFAGAILLAGVVLVFAIPAQG